MATCFPKQSFTGTESYPFVCVLSMTACTTEVELSSCEMACKAKNIYCLALGRKKLSTSVLVKNVNLKFSKPKRINLRIFIQVGFYFCKEFFMWEIAIILNLFYFLIKGY